MKNLLILGPRIEADRLNYLLRLKNKYNLNTIIYDGDIWINNNKVKANPEDKALFYDLICGAGFNPKSNAIQFDYIQLYCDGVLSAYSLGYTGARVVLQDVSADYFNTLQ